MKSQDKELQLSRRSFIRQSACAALGYAGMVNAITQLTIMNSALGQSTLPGYKALVVLFLGGGNDSNNMLIPQLGHPEYNNYIAIRRVLTIYDPTDPTRGTGPASIPLTTVDGKYGLHPNMQHVADIFHAGDLSFVTNVGTLAFPIPTREDYINERIPIPPQLGSHADQVIQWQSSLPDKPFLTGWGGRVADLLNANTPNSISMSISVAGINKFQVGLETAQYNIDASGTIPGLAGYGANYSWAFSNGTYNDTVHGRRLRAFDDVLRYTRSNLIEEGYSKVVRKSRDTEALLASAFTAATSSGVNFDALFGTATTGLSAELKTISKLIAGRSALGNNRQIFFAGVGGYDTHGGQMPAHANLMNELSTSLKAFRDAMIALGMNDNVLTITNSDFARTLQPNGTDPSTGSDHGWGGHHIVMGGGVNGSRIFGHFPTLVIGTGLDSRDRGTWIPTTSVDQYAAVAAKWLGVDSSNLSLAFPNLGRFDDPFGSTANLLYI
ncbi:MAG TPA: DUF1501 domain-containing protein [Chthoniobacterales bacterium]